MSTKIRITCTIPKCVDTANVKGDTCSQNRELNVYSTSYYVWNADDACNLRKNHRIVGSLVGTLPTQPYQNSLFSLPLELMLEEVALLVRKNIAELVSGPSLDLPSQEKYMQYMASQTASIEEQQKINLQLREQQKQKYLDEIAEGEAKRVKRRKTEDGNDSSEIKERNVNKNFLVQILTNDSSDSVSLLPLILPSQENLKSHLKIDVFHYLWEEGYYLTSGEKFGGDFLVYPGDPEMFHAFYIVVCLLPDETFNGKDLAALVRLGTSVKKTVAIATRGKDKHIVITSMKWSAITF